MNLATLFKKKAKTTGPKDFFDVSGWTGKGVLCDFDGLHGLSILVAEETPDSKEEDFNKTWFSDADEVIFRHGIRIMLYWDKNKTDEAGQECD